PASCGVAHSQAASAEGKLNIARVFRSASLKRSDVDNICSGTEIENGRAAGVVGAKRKSSDRQIVAHCRQSQLTLRSGSVAHVDRSSSATGIEDKIVQTGK